MYAQIKQQSLVLYLFIEKNGLHLSIETGHHWSSIGKGFFFRKQLKIS